MDLRRTATALVAGTATLLLVTVAVTAVLEPRIEFSIFIGIPAGLITAVLITAGVAIALRDPTATPYAFGIAAGVAGVTVLLTTVVGVALQYRFSTVLYTAVLLGAVLAIIAAVLTWHTL